MDPVSFNEKGYYHHSWSCRVNRKRKKNPIPASLLFCSLLLAASPSRYGQQSAVYALGTSPPPPFQYAFKLGATRCYSCPSGNYSDKEGSGICEACPPGTYNPTNGSLSCLSCRNGTFNPMFGATSCLRCPTATFNGSTTCPPEVEFSEYYFCHVFVCACLRGLGLRLAIK